MGHAAERIFPTWFVGALVIGALLAAATSINGFLLTEARDVRALAQDGWLPRFLATESGRSGGPVYAAVFLTALSIIGVFMGATIREYAIVAALALMAVQLVLGTAAWRIPTRMATECATAGSGLRPLAHRVAWPDFHFAALDGGRRGTKRPGDAAVRPAFHGRCHFTT